MSEQQYAYPFDPTGQVSSNRIVNERHTINPPDYTDFYFVVPLAGPFFKENLTVRHWPSGRELIDGVDFVLGYQFLGASRATAKPVYGAISIYDRQLTGVLEITYNTLGGEWTINEEKAAEMLANVMYNPRISTWEQVVDQPATFPVIDHEWDLVDLVGGAEVVDMLDEIRQAILDGSGGEDAVASHILNFENPHRVTKAQVGLPLVGNYPLASINEGNEGARDDRYMTPVRTKDAIDTFVGDAFQQHASDIENPHQVTKAQVGLSELNNYPTANDVEARDGTSPSRYLTPYGASLLIADKIGTGVKAHLTNYTNPHQVNASQIGLGSVPNYPMATNVVAQEGNSIEYFMSPYHTAILINEMVSAPLGAHIADRDNPHSVTKSQVGLDKVENLSLANEFEAREATALNKYMTPYTVRLTIEELVGGSLANHPGDTDNPHQVTKAQVGLGSLQNYPMANTPEMTLGTATNRYVSPKLVSEYVAQGVASDLQNHKDRLNNPHQVTKAQVGLGNLNDYATATEIQSRNAVRSDLYMTPQGVKWSIDSFISTSYGNLANRLGTLETTQGDHVNDLDNPHNITLTQLGGMSQTLIEARLDGKLDIDATALNSALLEGQSVQDILSQVESDVSNTYVTQNEVTILRDTLSTTFEDGMWELQGKTAIRLQASSANGVFTQTTDRIVAVDGGDGNVWHIGGTGGLMARSIDNGLTWSASSLSTVNDISDIKCLGIGVWLVSTVVGEVFRSTDDGLTWSPMDLGVAPAFEIITMVTDGVGRAVLVGGNTIQESTDSGGTWSTQIALITVTNVQSAALDVNDNLLLAGSNGLYAYNAVDGEVSMAGVPNSVAMQHVAVDITGHIVAVDVDGVHHRYSPVNVAWQTLDYINKLKELKVDNQNLWVEITITNLVRRSVDNGRFWGTVPTTPDAVELFGLGSSATGWIVGGAGGNVYLSID